MLINFILFQVIMRLISINHRQNIKMPFWTLISAGLTPSFLTSYPQLLVNYFFKNDIKCY